MGIIKKTEFDNDVKQLEHLTEQIKQMNYNDNKFYSSIDTFNDYINYINMFGDI